MTIKFRNGRKKLHKSYLRGKYQNILIHTSKQQKRKKLKMDKGHEQIFFQRRRKNGQHIHENVLNLNNQQGNINQNYSVTLLQINFCLLGKWIFSFPHTLSFRHKPNKEPQT